MLDRKYARATTAVLGAALAGMLGCALLLDTDKLQEGTGQPAAGAGGAVPDGEVPDTTQDSEPVQDATLEAEVEAEAATPCTSDLECFAASDRDVCFHHTCDTALGVCNAPEPWAGPVFVETSTSAIEITSNQDVIGVPALLADGEAVIVAAWYQNSNGADVLLHKYYPGQTAKKEAFSGLLGEFFKTPAATPGLMLESSPKRLALLLPAASQLAGSKKCVRRFWVGENLEKPSAFPSGCYDLVNGASDYTADPRRTSPRLFATGASTDLGMWIQDGDLVTTDGGVGSKATTLGTLQAFEPLRALYPLRGALLVAGATPQTESTYLWHSNTTPSELFNVAPGPRLGVANAWFTNPVGLNIAAWAHPAAGSESIVETFEVGCDKATCTTATEQTPAVQTGALLHSPSIALRQNPAPAYVDVSVSAVFTQMSQDATHSGLVLQAFRMQNQTVTPINPVALVVATADAATQTPIPDVPYLLGRNAVLLTDTGAMYLVWVQKMGAKEAMFMRTFQIKDTCS